MSKAMYAQTPYGSPTTRRDLNSGACDGKSRRELPCNSRYHPLSADSIERNLSMPCSANMHTTFQRSESLHCNRKLEDSNETIENLGDEYCAWI